MPRDGPENSLSLPLGSVSLTSSVSATYCGSGDCAGRLPQSSCVGS